MRKILNKDEYAYRGCGIYEYTRKQNGGNGVDVKIHIHPSQIELFETLSGVVLNNPIQIHIN